MQAIWAGYYTEPRMIVDPAKGLMVGLREARLYAFNVFGKNVYPSYYRSKTPEYFKNYHLKEKA